MDDSEGTDPMDRYRQWLSDCGPRQVRAAIECRQTELDNLRIDREVLVSYLLPLLGHPAVAAELKRQNGRLHALLLLQHAGPVRHEAPTPNGTSIRFLFDPED